MRDPKLLQHHHIIGRKEIGTSNSPWNLAVLCAHCHLKHHSGEIKILGVLPAANKQGRILVYEIDGKKNIDVDEIYFKPKPIGMKMKG